MRSAYQAEVYVPEHIIQRQMYRERRQKNDRDTPARVEQMRTTCSKLGVAIEQMDPYRYRLTKGDRVLDYCPRTRSVLSTGSKRLGVGLRFALTCLLGKKPFRNGQ